MLIDRDADFSSHHIEGYAHAAQGRGDGYFSAPLVSQIRENLWTGGCIDGVRLPDEFSYVVSLYPWEKYELGNRTTRFEFKMFDSPEVNTDILDEIVEIAAYCVSVGQTLIHCQAGLNRSGLIAGLVLIRGGMAPRDAIQLLREKRSPVVLCNRTFEEWLLASV